jgi:hypothetical protein
MVLLMLIGLLEKAALFPPIFLFLPVNELSKQLNEALHNQHIKGIKLSECGPVIHSLIYADDLIIT